MSDPVASNEIEDVLSSIRRLVSENRKDARKPDTAGSLDASKPAETARIETSDGASSAAFMLTPALRVTDNEGQENTSTHDPASPEEPANNEVENVAEAVGEERAAEGQIISLADTLNDPEDDQHDGQSASGELSERPIDALTTQKPEDDFEDEVSDFDQEVEAITAVGADIGDASSGSDDEDAEPVVAELHSVGSATETSNIEAPFVEGGSSENAEDIEMDDAPFDFEKMLDARIADWKDDPSPEEPDAPGDSDYAGTETSGVSWLSDEESIAEPVILEAMSAELEEEFTDDDFASQALGELDAASDDDAVIDEDALREMVADIVRQELQGALGERITRNVRKLVRREIHRALAAHQLD